MYWNFVSTSKQVRLLYLPYLAYIIIGMADAEGVVATDQYKLLPTPGRYACTINGKATTCDVVDGVVKQTDYFSEKIEILL